jgi:hypothetical protein
VRTDTTAVDLIERVANATPFCHCGIHTTLVERGDIVWLDCASLLPSRSGGIRRILRAAASHTHEQIVDLRELHLAA